MCKLFSPKLDFSCEYIGHNAINAQFTQNGNEYWKEVGVSLTK